MTATNPNDTSSTLSTSPSSQNAQELVALLRSISHQIIVINMKVCHLGQSFTLVLQLVDDQIRLLKCRYYAQCELPLTGKIIQDCDTPVLVFYSPLSEVRMTLEFVRVTRRVCHESDEEELSESLTGSDEDSERKQGACNACKSAVHVFGEVHCKDGSRWKLLQKFSALSVSASHMQPLLEEFGNDGRDGRIPLGKKTIQLLRNGLSSKL